jgi:hypothetical protein
MPGSRSRPLGPCVAEALGAEEGERSVEVVRGTECGGEQQRWRRVELERQATMAEAEAVARVP